MQKVGHREDDTGAIEINHQPSDNEDNLDAGHGRGQRGEGKAPFLPYGAPCLAGALAVECASTDFVHTAVT